MRRSKEPPSRRLIYFDCLLMFFVCCMGRTVNRAQAYGVAHVQSITVRSEFDDYSLDPEPVRNVTADLFVVRNINIYCMMYRPVT